MERSESGIASNCDAPHSASLHAGYSELSEEPPVILRRDHIAGAIFVVAGVVLYLVSGDLPFGSMAMPGAGMMPKLVIGFMVVCGIALLAQAQESPPFAAIAW